VVIKKNRSNWKKHFCSKGFWCNAYWMEGSILLKCKGGDMRIIKVVKCSECPYFSVRWAGDIVGCYAIICKRGRTLGLEKLNSPYSIPAKYNKIPQYCPLKRR